MDWPSRPARRGRGGSATRARSPSSARSSTPSSGEGEGGRRTPGRSDCEPDDFELVEAETADRDGDRAAARPVVLDAARGHFVHAKQMALALHALIEGRYPTRHAVPVGFSDYARRWSRGTWPRRVGARVRDEHAARVQPGRRLLSEHPAVGPSGDHGHRRRADRASRGRAALFSWPPVPGTIRLTLAEAMSSRRRGDAEHLHARGVSGVDPVHGAARGAHGGARVPDGRPGARSVRVGDYVARRARPTFIGASHQVVTACSAGLADHSPSRSTSRPPSASATWASRSSREAQPSADERDRVLAGANPPERDLVDLDLVPDRVAGFLPPPRRHRRVGRRDDGRPWNRSHRSFIHASGWWSASSRSRHAAARARRAGGRTAADRAR